MQTIKINLSNDIRMLEIVPIADIHIGDPNCDMKLLQKTIDYIENNKNVYCICNGDLMNTALKTSVSDVYSDVLSPMDQLFKVRELLSPIKEKILCMTNGNHERRIPKNDGIDVTQLLARELGLEDRYSPASAVIFLKFGRKDTQHGRKEQQMQYSISVMHGCGGGRKIGGKLNKLEEITGVIDCDVYIHSHTHLPAVFKQNFFRTNLTHQSVEEVEKLFVNTNAFLNYGGYGEVYEFRPASRSVPKIYLSGTERFMEAKI